MYAVNQGFITSETKGAHDGRRYYTLQIKLFLYCQENLRLVEGRLTEWVIAEAREDHDDVGVVIDAVVDG